MSEILLDAVDPADVTRYARELAAATPGALSAFLPNRPIEGRSTKSVKVSRTTAAAQVRAYDAETPIGKRNVLATVTRLDLQPLGQKLPLRESEILNLAQASGDWKDVIDAVYDDTATNVAAILNRAEMWRAEFLFTGAVAIDQNGVKMTADFGLAADHNLAVGSGFTPWDNTGADPIEDELAWAEKVKDDSGEDVIATIGSRTVWKAYRDRLSAAKIAAGDPFSLTPAQVNELRAQYGLPAFVIYDEKVGGVRLAPETKVAMVTGTVGETQWGQTAEELELFGSKAVETTALNAPRIASAAWKNTDPVMVWSKSNATALPVAGDISGLFVADVLLGYDANS